MNSITEAEALVASIFSFSARFHAGEKDESLWSYFPAPSYFAKIASKRIEDALGPYDETPPPLWLLQASVLDTFYRLTRSVRSSSWRATGNLVRLAYDLGLHLVDVDGQRRDSQGNIDVEFWSAQEEQRRCWWAIWELDVYASTIRRLPLGMHWSQTYTLLPIHDSDWFENRYRPSCRLPQDATTRSETLLASGNTSPRAWFIAVSSLMHDAQQLAYTPETNQDLTGSQKAQQLAGIANCLSHTTTALPAGLRYLGETLDFRTKAAPSEASLRQHHADIFSIHMVTQLTRFMLYHQRVHAVSQTSPGVHGSPASHSQGEQAAADDAAWTNYMEASEAIVTLVRNSAPDSYKYLNPLVAHAALWFAATAQSTYLGRSRYSKTLAASNYELLARFIEQCVGFWGSAEILRPRLGKSEAAALDNLMHTPEQQRDGSHGAGRAGGGGDAEMETPPMMNSDSTGHGAPGYADLVGMQVGGDGGLDGPQQAGTLSFLPMLQERPLMSQLGSFEDLEYLFPYGVDNASGQGSDNPPPAV
ncbi:fungal specific transcription [Cordyceps militaris]|uniref:Fungal specific transcription n=1 Tax=Cordyceps militaris TaxID=73501 RepID=A0A2H4SLC4_CORMI|nr:fungal specific transcription [Cordyceps militaris]